MVVDYTCLYMQVCVYVGVDTRASRRVVALGLGSPPQLHPDHQQHTRIIDLALLVSRLVEADMYGGRVAAGDGVVGPITRDLLEKDVVPWAR